MEIPLVSDDFTSAKQGRKQVDVQDLQTEITINLGQEIIEYTTGKKINETLISEKIGSKFLQFLDNNLLNEDLFGTSLKLKPYETLMVKSVVSFMMDKFNFNAKIIVKKKDKAGMIGDISLNSNSVDGNKFYLHFNPNQSYKRIIQSMIHELTHVKQVSKNELLPNKDYTAILWKGKEYITAKEYGR